MVRNGVGESGQGPGYKSIWSALLTVLICVCVREKERETESDTEVSGAVDGIGWSWGDG